MRIRSLALSICLLAKAAVADEGDDYIVIFDNDHPSSKKLDVVLQEVNLHPSSPVVTHVFNNSAFSGFIAQLDKDHVSTLNNLAQVKTVEQSINVKIHATAVQGNAPWGLERISQMGKVSGDASQLTFKYTYDPDSHLGQGVDVYVVDTGVNTAHQTFGGRARMVYSVNGQNDLSASADQDGHGTHVSGTCCGAGYGAAPRANVFGVKVLGADGSGSSSDTIKGIDFVVQSHDQRRQQNGFVASVASMSWGLGGISSSVEQAIKSATEAGIHVVVAAGNDGKDACTSTPGSVGGTAGTAISVGSVGTGDTVSSFSNTGKCVDIYAPGENIVSSYIGGNTQTKVLSGTSMSTPHVTGVIATLLSHYTNLRDPATMKRFIANIGLRGTVQGANAQSLILLNNGQRGAGLGGSGLLNGNGITTVTITPTITVRPTAGATAQPGLLSPQPGPVAAPVPQPGPAPNTRPGPIANNPFASQPSQGSSGNNGLGRFLSGILGNIPGMQFSGGFFSSLGLK